MSEKKNDVIVAEAIVRVDGEGQKAIGAELNLGRPANLDDIRKWGARVLLAEVAILTEKQKRP